MISNRHFISDRVFGPEQNGLNPEKNGISRFMYTNITQSPNPMVRDEFDPDYNSIRIHVNTYPDSGKHPLSSKIIL